MSFTSQPMGSSKTVFRPQAIRRSMNPARSADVAPGGAVDEHAVPREEGDLFRREDPIEETDVITPLERGDDVRRSAEDLREPRQPAGAGRQHTAQDAVASQRSREARSLREVARVRVT